MTANEMIREMVACENELLKLQQEVYMQIEDPALRRKVEELYAVMNRLQELEALNRMSILKELENRFGV